jgi:hypothetical protein
MVKQPANIIIQHIVKRTGLDDFAESPEWLRTTVEHRTVTEIRVGSSVLLGPNLPAVTARFTVIHRFYPLLFYRV